MEYTVGCQPQAIKIDILDSQSNKPECKLVKLSCQSAPKTYELEINAKKQPKFFETDAESEKRRRLKLLGDKELDITDFVKQYPRTVALALFVKKL